MVVAFHSRANISQIIRTLDVKFFQFFVEIAALDFQLFSGSLDVPTVCIKGITDEIRFSVINHFQERFARLELVFLGNSDGLGLGNGLWNWQDILYVSR